MEQAQREPAPLAALPEPMSVRPVALGASLAVGVRGDGRAEAMIETLEDLRKAAERVLSSDYQPNWARAQRAEACARAVLAAIKDSTRWGVCGACGQGERIQQMVRAAKGERDA